MDNDIEVEKNNDAFALSNVIKELTGNAEEAKESKAEDAVEQTADAQETAEKQEAVEEQSEESQLPGTEVEVYSVPNTESEVMLFLGEELEPLRRKKHINVYDLETEYAKTRKNKLWSVWVMLVLTFLVVVLVTVFTVGGLSASNERIEVNFSSFKDLDLQNLFNQLQRTQESFDEATKRYAELKGNMETRLAQARKKRDNDLNYIKNLKLARATTKARNDNVYAAYNREVSAIHKEFDVDLAAAEAEVKQYEEQLRSYDSESVSRAQEWEQQMDSERQIHQLEKQRLIESYQAQLDKAKETLEATKKKDFEERLAAINELTKRYDAEIASYDPVIKDSKTNGLIGDLEAVALQKFNAESIINSDVEVSESFAYALREAQTEYDNLEYLYGQSAAIPNKNTMKSVVASEQKLSANLVNKLATAAAMEIRDQKSSSGDVAQQLKDLEDQRDFAKNASKAYVDVLNKVAVDDKTAGFILDPKSNYGAAVFLRDAYVKNVRQDGSTRVEIYNGKTKVTTGALLAVSGNYYISLDKDSDKNKVAVGQTFRLSGKN